MLFIRTCILNSHVNLNQNQPCRFQISSANNKCLLSYQLQNATVLSTSLSNSSPCSYINQIQFLFKCNLFLLMAKWLVRIQGQLVPVNLFLLSVKRPVRIQEQLVPILLISAEWPVQIQEQLVLSILLPVSQVTSSSPRTACAFYIFFQPSNQLKYKSSLRPLLSISSVKWLVHIQEQLVPVNLLSSLPGESCYLLFC